MSILVVNKRKFGELTEDYALPTNAFNIKEGNGRINIKNVLIDNPQTRTFSLEVVLLNDTPTVEEVSLDFGSVDLDITQENIVLSIIQDFRDKDEFTPLEQLSIDSDEQIENTLELIDGAFDEDTISEIELLDICGIRDQFLSMYNSNVWDFFSVGEKRILIADWLIPSFQERISVFQSSAKRQEIYKLFSAKITSLVSLQLFNDIALFSENEETQDFNDIFKRAFAPSKTKREGEVFISRSNSISSDAKDVTVNIPVFGNIRTDASFMTIINDEEGQINKTGFYDIEYSTSINANTNKNWRTGIVVDDSDIDGQGMQRDSRGRSTVSHPSIRVEFIQGQIIKLQLIPVNTNDSTLTSLNSRTLIRIKEVLK